CLGEKGENVNAVNGEFLIDTSVFQDNLPRFYNVTLPNGKMVFFFAVKDSNGSFHIAANACQVCSEAKMGFHAEEGMIVCNVCGNRYPIEKIATEKGGCNPVPVTPQAEIREGKIVIKVTDLEKIADYF
ncbi:MAG: Fe-S-containing protein, partial [Atribacterota bacterium]